MDVEILLIEVQHFDSNLQRVAGLLPFLRGSIDGHLQMHNSEKKDVLPVSERNTVGRILRSSNIVCEIAPAPLRMLLQ